MRSDGTVRCAVFVGMPTFAAHDGFQARLEVLERSGHRPWAEEPERFRAPVTEFLDDEA